MDLDLVETLILEAVGVVEEDGLVDAEDEGRGRDGQRVVNGVMASGGGGEGGDALDAMKGHEQDMIDDIEAHGCAYADFRGDKKGEPEGKHGGDEIDERGTPIVIEDANGNDNMPDSGNNDSSKGGLWNPVEGGTELEDGEDNDRAGQNTVCG